MSERRTEAKPEGIAYRILDEHDPSWDWIPPNWHFHQCPTCGSTDFETDIESGGTDRYCSKCGLTMESLQEELTGAQLAEFAVLSEKYREKHKEELSKLSDSLDVLDVTKPIEAGVDIDALREDLRLHLLERAQGEFDNPRPHQYAYSNDLLDELVRIRPRTKNALRSINGMGPWRMESSGDILRIIDEWLMRRCVHSIQSNMELLAANPEGKVSVTPEVLDDISQHFVEWARGRDKSPKRISTVEAKQKILELMGGFSDSNGKLRVSELRGGLADRGMVLSPSRLSQIITSMVKDELIVRKRPVPYEKGVVTLEFTEALRGSSKSRGDWGQISLRNVAESAGMTEHCDFDLELTLASGAGGGRVDMLARIPDGGSIPIDAKVPLAAYWDGLDLEDPDVRKKKMQEHAKAVKGHIDALVKRDYPSLTGGSDFTVMYIPASFKQAAAYEIDPSLQEYALRKHVLIATPVVLLGLLRTVSVYWQQQSMAENAQEIQQAARDFYERSAKFVGPDAEGMVRNTN